MFQALGVPQKNISVCGFFINQQLPRINNYTRDSTHIINFLKGITDLCPNAVLCTLDISSLYTNIPHEKGIKTMCKGTICYDAPCVKVQDCGFP